MLTLFLDFGAFQSEHCPLSHGFAETEHIPWVLEQSCPKSGDCHPNIGHCHTVLLWAEHGLAQ